MEKIKYRKKCVYFESNPDFNLITFDDNRKEIRISKDTKKFCWFFRQECGKDFNFECKPSFMQCKKCGSSNMKYKNTFTPAFDEIGHKFKCEDCGEEFYRWH